MERAELIRFLDSLECAERRGGFTFLRDPHWSEVEQAAAAAQMAAAERLTAPQAGWLCVRTGGSGGGMKFARHDEVTLAAAAEGFRAHFALKRVDTVGVLPPWHVSGMMARLRSFASGGTYIDAAWKDLETGRFPTVPSTDTVLSLVPTQLQRLLNSASAVDWLRQFAIVFLGGGPTWPELADEASRREIRVALSYGMTETAAMVTAQRPSEFAAGDRTNGSPLPHARVRIDGDGRVVVGGTSLFRGYFPDIFPEAEFATQDIGRIDSGGRLCVLGRVDDVVITGGKKVSAAEIEASLRASGEFADVAVIGVPDQEWGEVVVACYPRTAREPNFQRAVTALAPHQRPKRFVAVPDWPRNAQGKINRSELAAKVANI